MTEQKQQEPPRVSDPGGEGWPEEPKGVTPAEEVLYGPLAGVIRLLGQAAVAAKDAYMLTCKHAQHDESFQTDEQRAAYREAIQDTWQLYENATAVYQGEAGRATALQRSITGMHFRIMTNNTADVPPMSARP